MEPDRYAEKDVHLTLTYPDISSMYEVSGIFAEKYFY
jgi:hypothetical protein